MEFAFALPDACSVAYGAHGVWVNKDEAWFADDPFVQAHPEMFSLIPPRVRSTTGRSVEQVPMSGLEALQAAARIADRSPDSPGVRRVRTRD